MPIDQAANNARPSAACRPRRRRRRSKGASANLLQCSSGAGHFASGQRFECAPEAAREKRANQSVQLALELSSRPRPAPLNGRASNFCLGPCSTSRRALLFCFAPKFAAALEAYERRWKWQQEQEQEFDVAKICIFASASPLPLACSPNARARFHAELLPLAPFFLAADGRANFRAKIRFTCSLCGARAHTCCLGPFLLLQDRRAQVGEAKLHVSGIRLALGLHLRAGEQDRRTLTDQRKNSFCGPIKRDDKAQVTAQEALSARALALFKCLCAPVFSALEGPEQGAGQARKVKEQSVAERAGLRFVRVLQNLLRPCYGIAA